MTFKHFRFRALLAASLGASIAFPAGAEPVTGEGSAPITKDVETVRTRAEAEARKAIVIELAKMQIGRERLGELTPDIVASLSKQIRPDMIIRQTPAKDGANYKITIDADIDRAWFKGMLENEGIRTASELAGGARQLIFVMIDEDRDIGRDSTKPLSVQTEFDSRKGASYSDRSVAAFSDKEKAASSYSDKQAASARASGAVGYSNYYGSGAASSRASASSASSTKAAAAYSRSTSAIDKKDIQSEVHDDVRFRQTTVYQAGLVKSGPSEAARRAFMLELTKYGVEIAASDIALNDYFKGNIPTFDVIRKSPEFGGFLRYVAGQNATFMMGGKITITDTGKDPATGQFTCLADLSVETFAMSNSKSIAPGSNAASSMGSSYEECAGSAARNVAKLVSDDVGPLINSHWRTQMRNMQATVANATQGGQYTLVVRAPSLDMATQSDMFDALGALQGLESQALLEAGSTQMSWQVTYKGAMPLPNALYMKLRANPAYAKMTSKVEGQIVTLCLSTCQ